MSSDNIFTLGESNFESEVLTSKGTVLVDFWAEWCGPCRAIAPVIEQLAAEYSGKAKICKLNIDADGAVAAKYGVMSIPTLLIFKDGSEAERIVGLRSFEFISELLDAHI